MKRGTNDDDTDDYARIDREALELLKDAGPVKGLGFIALHMAQEVAIASRPRPNPKGPTRCTCSSSRCGGRHTVTLCEPCRLKLGTDEPSVEFEVSFGQRVKVREEPGVHPVYGAYDAVYTLDPDDLTLMPGERILTADEVGGGEDRKRELEEMNRKPGRLANLDLRGL